MYSKQVGKHEDPTNLKMKWVKQKTLTAVCVKKKIPGLIDIKLSTLCIAN